MRDGFHNASHHSNERKNMDQFAVINQYHVKMLGYFLERLQTTPDGDGSLHESVGAGEAERADGLLRKHGRR